jgi:N4-gp56 family major capsid protein
MALTISATDTELPAPLNAVFQQTLLRNAMVRCPYFMGTTPAELTKHRGSFQASFRRIANLSAATSGLSELQSEAAYMQGRSAAALSVAAVNATVAKYGNFVILNEEADLVNFPEQFAKILEIVGRNAGQSLNVLQRNIGEDNVTLVRAGGAASDGAITSIIAVNTIKNVLNVLDKNSAMSFMPMTTGSQNIGTVPILPAFWGLCHPDVAVDIAGLTGFTSVEKYAGQTATVMGEFGTLMVAGQGVRFVSSEDAGVDASAGSTGAASNDHRTTASDKRDLYTTLIYGQDAIGSIGFGMAHTDGIYRAGDSLNAVDVIVKTPQGTGTSDPYNEITTVAWKAWHTGMVLNTAWARGIRSAATNFAND